MAEVVSSTGGAGELDLERGLVRTSHGYIHYRAAGSGRPIFMIHTQHRSSELFLPMMRGLASEYRCYAMDLPWCGFSDHPKEEATTKVYTECVHEVVHALGLRDFIGMGYAIGSVLSCELAATEPDLVRALILHSLPFFQSRQYADEQHVLRRATLQTDETGFPRLLTLKQAQDRSTNQYLNRPINPTQEWVDEENREMVMAGRDLWAAMGASSSFDRGAMFDRIECPTLLLYGKDFVYTQQSDEIARRIKNHRLVRLEDAEFFVHLDQPEKYWETIRSFLKELG